MLCLLPSARAATSVRFISFSSSTSAPPAVLLKGGSIETDGDARFAKLSVVLENPVTLTKVRIESCGKDFADGVEFHFAPGYRSSFSEGGHKHVEGMVRDPSVPVRAFSIVFRHNDAMCLKALTATGASGGPVDWGLPTTVRSDAAKSKFARATEIVAPLVPFSRQVNPIWKAFAEHGLVAGLDRELKTRDEEDPWSLRLRSDGTYYVQGKTDDPKMASSFTSSGSFEIIKRENKRITLRLQGSRFATPQGWDGLACPFACGERELRTGLDVVDEVELEKLPGAVFMLRNRTPRKARALPFSDLRMSVSTLEE